MRGRHKIHKETKLLSDPEDYVDTGLMIKNLDEYTFTNKTEEDILEIWTNLGSEISN